MIQGVKPSVNPGVQRVLKDAGLFARDGVFAASNKLLTDPAYTFRCLLWTRLAIAAGRVLMDTPAFNKNPRLNDADKWQSVAERCFMEFGGTLLYTGALHVGHDLAAAVVNRRPGLRPVLELPRHGDQINAALKDVYGRNPIVAAFYEEADHQKVLDVLKRRYNVPMDKLLQEEIQAVKAFSSRVKRSGSLTFMVGIALSAFLGGTFVQKLNDQVVAPLLSKARKHLSGSPKANAPLPPTGQPTVSLTPTPPAARSLQDEALPQVFRTFRA